MGWAPWLVVAVCSGCFSKPEPPHGDAGGGDAQTCQFGNWSMPVAIDVMLGANDAATSPWLSDLRDDLYFSVLFGGDSNNSVIEHSTFSAGQWLPYEAVPLPDTQDDNPFLAESGSLWFDSKESGRQILEARPPLDVAPVTTIAHPELIGSDGQGKEPSVAADGTVYFADNEPKTTLYVHQRNGTATALATRAYSLESPSILSDGTLFFSDFMNGPGDELIAQGNVASGMLVGESLVAPFQSDGIYFDPNISRDGKTLAFAQVPLGQPRSRLFYVTRECVP